MLRLGMLICGGGNDVGGEVGEEMGWGMEGEGR